MPYGGTSYYSPYQIFGSWGGGWSGYSMGSPAGSYYGAGGWGNYSPSFNFDFNTPGFTQPPTIGSNTGAYSPSFNFNFGSPAFTQTPSLGASTESVTVSTPAPAAPTLQLQAPAISPDPFAYGGLDYWPSVDFNTAQSPVESVTVTADRQPQQVQAPQFSFANINFDSPFWSMPAISSPYAGNVESVTVGADRPPQQVVAPQISPFLPAFTPANFPFPTLPAAVRQQQAQQQQQQKKSSGGGAGGGLPAPGQPKQQQQQQQPQRPIFINQQQRPPQQQAANPYLNLTPQQLQNLLANARTLTPLQRQQIQSALQQKQRQAAAAGARPGGSAPAQQQKKPAAPASSPAAAASPISGNTLGLALLAAGAVALAYKVTHHKTEIAATVRRVGRRLKRTVQHA